MHFSGCVCLAFKDNSDFENGNRRRGSGAGGRSSLPGGAPKRTDTDGGWNLRERARAAQRRHLKPRRPPVRPHPAPRGPAGGAGPDSRPSASSRGAGVRALPDALQLPLLRAILQGAPRAAGPAGGAPAPPSAERGRPPRPERLRRGRGLRGTTRGPARGLPRPSPQAPRPAEAAQLPGPATPPVPGPPPLREGARPHFLRPLRRPGSDPGVPARPARPRAPAGAAAS